MKTDLIKIASFAALEWPPEIYGYTLLGTVIQIGEGVQEIVLQISARLGRRGAPPAPTHDHVTIR